MGAKRQRHTFANFVETEEGVASTASPSPGTASEAGTPPPVSLAGIPPLSSLLPARANVGVVPKPLALSRREGLEVHFWDRWRSAVTAYGLLGRKVTRVGPVLGTCISVVGGLREGTSGRPPSTAKWQYFCRHIAPRSTGLCRKIMDPSGLQISPNAPK